MKLSDDLEKLLVSFQELMDESNDLVRENTKNKTLVKEKEAELVEQSSKCEQLEKDLRQQQELLEIVHKQLVLIPELKSEIEKQNTAMAQLESRLEHKDQDIAKLKQKHLNDLNFLRMEIEDDRLKSREAENRRIMDLEEFYKEAQVAEVASLMKKVEREKQSLTEVLNKKEEELRNISTEHEEELEKLKVQLAAAKNKENSSSPSAFGSEFYRKKILAMQEHYENQIQELIDSRDLPVNLASEQQVPPPKSSPKTHGVLASKPTVPSSPTPSWFGPSPEMDEFDQMAADVDNFFKAAPTSKSKPTSTSKNQEPRQPALKKKKVTFRLSSSQNAKVTQKENGNVGHAVGSEEMEIAEASSSFFSTPTNRNKRRDPTTTGFQFLPSSTPKSGRTPLNENFWNSIITEESSPSSPFFSDVSVSRVSPKKTSTVTSAFSQFQEPMASSFSRSIPSHSTVNNNSSFVNSKPQTKFKFSNINRSQSGNAGDFGSFRMTNTNSSSGGGSGDASADPKDNRGMKRKLFREKFGPQEM